MGTEVYINDLPELPCESKMIEFPFENNRFVTYKPSQLEMRYKYNLEENIESLMNFDLVDILSWESPWVRIEQTIPRSKKRKHPQTDPSNASTSSYYQHYLKMRKDEILKISNLALKLGKVSAGDLTIPINEQLKMIPKDQQIPLYSLEGLSEANSQFSITNSNNIPWLKRTEYILGRDDQNHKTPIIGIDDEIFEDDENKQLSSSVNDDDSSYLGPSGTMVEKDSIDHMVDSLNSQSKISKSSLDSLVSPFTIDPTKVLNSIETSFDVVSSRSAIIHPSQISSISSKNDTLKNSQSITPILSTHIIVEEWDLFPDDIIWDNYYVSIQSESEIPSSDSIFIPIKTNGQSLLKLASTVGEDQVAHDSHKISSKTKEYLSLYVPNQILNPKSSSYNWNSDWEVDATSLKPGFETNGTFAIMLGPTTQFNPDEDEEDGISYKASSEQETRSILKNRLKSLQDAKIGTATYKNIDARIQLKIPTSSSRKEISEIKKDEHIIKNILDEIPEQELYMRGRAHQSINGK